MTYINIGAEVRFLKQHSSDRIISYTNLQGTHLSLGPLECCLNVPILSYRQLVSMNYRTAPQTETSRPELQHKLLVYLYDIPNHFSHLFTFITQV